MFRTAAVMGVAGLWGYKYWNRHKKDETILKSLPKSRQWTEAGVFASLVDVVYRRDISLLDVDDIDCDTERRESLLHDIDRNTERLLHGLNYKPVDDITYDIKRLMVFGRVGDRSSRGNAVSRVEKQNKPVQWPEYVVAIRGTIFSSATDLSQDLQILWESLSPSTYEPVIDLLLELYRRHPGPDGVCVVGHSLGAAIALIATTALAIDPKPIVLDTHLFNPPYLTPGVWWKKVVKGMASGLADGATNILGIGDDGGRIIRDVAKWSINKVDKKARAWGEALAPGTYKELTQRYDTLRSREYRPNIYLNPNDPVSNGYIEHFKRSSPRLSIAVLIWKNFVSHCESPHLIPLARVHTNHFAVGPKHAHGLDQWWCYEPVNLISTDAV